MCGCAFVYVLLFGSKLNEMFKILVFFLYVNFYQNFDYCRYPFSVHLLYLFLSVIFWNTMINSKKRQCGKLPQCEQRSSNEYENGVVR